LSIQQKMANAPSVAEAKTLYETEMKAKGISIDAPEGGGPDWTALHLAGFRAQGLRPAGRADVVEYLLSQGANIEARDAVGRTPLMCAAMQGNDAVARVLIAHGANMNAVDNTGRTPLNWAIWGENPAIIAMLRDRGANQGNSASFGLSGTDLLQAAGAGVGAGPRRAGVQTVVTGLENAKSPAPAGSASPAPQSACPCTGANPVFSSGQCYPNSNAACGGNAQCQWKLCP
jgi:hypothetical protein